MYKLVAMVDELLRLNFLIPGSQPPTLLDLKLHQPKTYRSLVRVLNYEVNKSEFRYSHIHTYKYK